MPILQGALLCDAAREYNGLVSVLGGFISVLYVRQLPAPAPVWFAGRVGFSLDELDRPHRIVVEAHFGAASAIPLARAEISLTPPEGSATPVPHPELASGMNVVSPMPFLMAQEGMYRVGLTVDEVLLVELPLKVVRMAGAE